MLSIRFALKIGVQHRKPDWALQDDYASIRAVLLHSPNSRAFPDLVDQKDATSNDGHYRCPDSAELAALQFIYNDNSLREEHRDQFMRDAKSGAFEYLSQMTLVSPSVLHKRGLPLTPPLFTG